MDNKDAAYLICFYMSQLTDVANPNRGKSVRQLAYLVRRKWPRDSQNHYLSQALNAMTIKEKIFFFSQQSLAMVEAFCSDSYMKPHTTEVWQAISANPELLPAKPKR